LNTEIENKNLTNVQLKFKETFVSMRRFLAVEIVKEMAIERRRRRRNGGKR